MKARLLLVFAIVAGLALVFSWAVAAQEQGIETQAVKLESQATNAAFNLRLNLGSNDPTINPVFNWNDAPSLFVFNQLFIGLTRLDDETGEPLPDLATGWEMSADGMVFTFTLRSDATWTDSNPVTAYDVRYGILRNLDPDTGAQWAYPLFVIQNAADYNDGSITDPNLVGITVLDNTHLRFDLEEPTAHLPNLLALPTAKALPAAVITAHPEDWTEPANIVTNGPYLLSTWAHGTSMTLQRNSAYFDANNVQIEQVSLAMVDETTGWGMYLAGQLDSAVVPADQWTTARNDPLLQQELHTAHTPCTYYYGFNTAKAPFDDVNVRKAFMAALSKQVVLNEALGYAQSPALTFTPPGVDGYVDGATAGVGIPFDPTQAQTWLADAGYPGGVGLPEVTLMFNTMPGHQAIAEAARQQWLDNLGVTVVLSDTEWGAYLDLLANDPPQVWRMGWCGDHWDAYSFLHDAIQSRLTAYGNWNNPTYTALLDQAAETADPATRRLLYQQVEEILVETDAILLPIYHYANGYATRPDLERTYGDGGYGGRIAEWRFTWASAEIGSMGGMLFSYDGDTTVQLPAGGVTATITLTHTPATVPPPGGNLNRLGGGFDLNAAYLASGLPAHLAPGMSYSVTLSYDQSQVGMINEETLALYWWDNQAGAWSQQGLSSEVSSTEDLIIAQVDHFSLFAVLGEAYHRVFLPAVPQDLQ